MNNNINRLFHLQTSNTSYLLYIDDFDHLQNLYYGPKITLIDDDINSFINKTKTQMGTSKAYDESKDSFYNLNFLNLEVATSGKGDYRNSSLEIKSNKTYTSDFKVTDFHKEDITDGLLTPRGSDESLTFILTDEISGTVLELRYLVFKSTNVIARSSKISGKDVVINKAMSFNIDINNANYFAKTFSGAWSNEFYDQSHKLMMGTFKQETLAGPSSNIYNPGFIIHQEDATLDSGRYYGFNLIYSGPFVFSLSLQTNNILRIQAGINSTNFECDLNKCGSFITPWAIMSTTDNGQNGISRNMTNFVKNHITRKEFSTKPRPILLNNWEATYFDFNEKKLKGIIDEAADLGVELFVLDDGWFINRNDDFTGLGNYEIDKKKLPNGLKAIANHCKKNKMKFGLWFEPEMISEDTKIYQQHPEWAITIPNINPAKGRHQLVLDLTNIEVQNYIVDTVAKTLNSAEIEYVKWDYNSNISDVYSDNIGMFYYNYTVGLYSILKRLTEQFPHILWEGCASGGNRFDLGVLNFFDQIWLSDCSDSHERVRIQKNAGIMYPLTVFGAHVSAVPNHQLLRQTSLTSRFNIALFSGGFGYELDPTILSKLERKIIQNQIKYYKENREFIINSNLIQLQNKTSKDKTYLALISEKKDEAIVAIYNGISSTRATNEYLPSINMKEDITYQVKSPLQVTNISKFGTLIKAGLPKYIKYDGLIIKTLAKTKSAEEILSLKVEENYTVHGSVLKNGALLLNPEWTGTGFNENVRTLNDFGSIIYKISQKDANYDKITNEVIK